MKTLAKAWEFLNAGRFFSRLVAVGVLFISCVINHLPWNDLDDAGEDAVSDVQDVGGDVIWPDLSPDEGGGRFHIGQ